jgi:hypothetical protein
MGKVALKVRMHALKDGGETYQTNWDHPRCVIPEFAEQISGTLFLVRARKEQGPG